MKLPQAYIELLGVAKDGHPSSTGSSSVVDPDRPVGDQNHLPLIRTISEQDAGSGWRATCEDEASSDRPLFQIAGNGTGSRKHSLSRDGFQYASARVALDPASGSRRTSSWQAWLGGDRSGYSDVTQMRSEVVQVELKVCSVDDERGKMLQVSVSAEHLETLEVSGPVRA